MVPNFEFKCSQDFSAEHPLLSNLKSSLSNESEQKCHVCNDLSDKQTMIKNFEQQIKFEKKSLIQVPSIYTYNESTENEINVSENFLILHV